jgi:adenosine 3'-phospho 5'-phosphosulfate transporter B3
MLLGALVPGLRRVYSCQEYASAVLLVLGLISFTLADASSTPNFHVVGIIMILTSLMLDALLANMQEAIFSSNPATFQVRLRSKFCFPQRLGFLRGLRAFGNICLRGRQIF